MVLFLHKYKHVGRFSNLHQCTFNNIPYRKLSLNCKQHSKIRKEYVLIKFGKNLLNQRYSQIQKTICLQMFYKISVLESFQKQTCRGVLRKKSSKNVQQENTHNLPSKSSNAPVQTNQQSNIMEIVACVFIGILRNIFWS